MLLDRPDGESVLILECKSKIPGAFVSLEEARHWLSDRVPLIRNILGRDSRYDGRAFHFELWSNGPFHDDALVWLNAQNTDCDLYTVGWKAGVALRKYARKSKTSAIRNILKEHYFLHPLAKVSKLK